MKILHLAGESHHTGAGRGVLWLHQGLMALGVDSHVIYQFGGDEKIENVSTLHSGLKGKITQSLISRSDALPLINYPKNDALFSTGWKGNDITRHPIYKEADIIHLHWVNRAMLSTDFIGNIDKPLIWTLRDMWPFTGGCHYDNGCQKFTHVCGKCPQLGSLKSHDLSTKIQSRKSSKWKNLDINLVGISHWIQDCANQSTVFKHQKPAVMIPNCVNTTQFYPWDKKAARKSLGLPLHQKIVLCGAQNLGSPYKGFGHFLNAVPDINKSCLFVFFGKLDEAKMNSLGIKYVNMGMLKGASELAKIYSSADVFVAPSIQEAFGKTLIEAMACKTPVVCFDSTGPRDIIEHKVHGYKAEATNSADLAAGVNWLLSQPESYANTIGDACRQRVIDKYSTERVAEQYQHLYEQIVNTDVATSNLAGAISLE